jgi:hypothetical protein
LVGDWRLMNFYPKFSTGKNLPCIKPPVRVTTSSPGVIYALYTEGNTYSILGDLDHCGDSSR